VSASELATYALKPPLWQLGLVLIGDSLQRLLGLFVLVRGEEKADALGQPAAEDGEDEHRNGRETEKPTPAECRHHQDREDHFEYSAQRPEKIRQNDTLGAVLRG